MRQFFEALDAGVYTKPLCAFFMFVALALWLVPVWLERRALRRKQEAYARSAAEYEYIRALQKASNVFRTWGPGTPETHVAMMEYLYAYHQLEEAKPDLDPELYEPEVRGAMQQMGSVSSWAM